MPELAPYAVHPQASRGRKWPEPPAGMRSEFQRDRDRIVHSTSFRRLEYKTQVFVYHEGDHYRNRLTHSIEVAQIGRTMARALGLNEDLTEAICLAHDLGHPPFGHTGEHVLAELMADYGGFDHQRQTMRIVERLEQRYPGFPGLNLTYEVREGLVKHDTDYDVSDATGYEPDKVGTLEAQIANLADEIAYNTADLDDGLRSGILEPAAVAQVSLWQMARQALATAPEFPAAADAPLDSLLRARLIRKLIAAEVTDAISATGRRLERCDVQSVADVRNQGQNIAGFSADMRGYNRELKAFLWQHFYHHWRVNRMAGKARRILSDLFSVYQGDPKQLPPAVQAQFGASAEGIERVICDYIAGMTDRFAIQEHQKLFDPETRV